MKKLVFVGAGSIGLELAVAACKDQRSDEIEVDVDVEFIIKGVE